MASQVGQRRGGVVMGVGTNMNPLSIVSGTEREVCTDIANRQQFGINKYGKTVADNPANLFAWLKHAYEESLDFPIYLKRAMTELGGSQSFVVQDVRYMSGEVLLFADQERHVTPKIAAGDEVVLLIIKKGVR